MYPDELVKHLWTGAAKRSTFHLPTVVADKTLPRVRILASSFSFLSLLCPPPLPSMPHVFAGACLATIVDTPVPICAHTHPIARGTTGPRGNGETPPWCGRDRQPSQHAGADAAHVRRQLRHGGARPHAAGGAQAGGAQGRRQPGEVRGDKRSRQGLPQRRPTLCGSGKGCSRACVLTAFCTFPSLVIGLARSCIAGGFRPGGSEACILGCIYIYDTTRGVEASSREQ